MLVKHQCIIHINVIIKIFFNFYIYIYICLSCHLAGCKDTVVSDLVDRFRHPAATTGH